MTRRVSYVALAPDQQREIRALVGDRGWRIVPRVALPSAFPAAFRSKIDSAVVIAEPTSTGGTYLVFSASRVDAKAHEIDLEPFGVIVHSTGCGAVGAFVHHGNWDERSQAAPDGFWDSVSDAGVGGYFCTEPPGGLTAGSLEELPRGHRGAFDAAVKAVRADEDGRK